MNGSLPYFSTDKICDQISDAVLDAHLKQDPDAKVACGKYTQTKIIAQSWTKLTHRGYSHYLLCSDIIPLDTYMWIQYKAFLSSAEVRNLEHPDNWETDSWPSQVTL